MSGPTVAVLDYGMGNRRSVQKALEHVGAQVTLSSDRAELRDAAGLVLPGVGAFPLGISRLRGLGLAELIVQRVAEGTPLLGICLGMQLLFERSEELEPARGLGLLAGEVRRLRSGGLRIPHIGWNEVRFERPCPLTDALPGRGRAFYHVHSFVAVPANPETRVASAEYGERFATIVAQQNVFGVQFHPEKSSIDGLRMLRSFVALCAAPVHA